MTDTPDEKQTTVAFNNRSNNSYNNIITHTRGGKEIGPRDKSEDFVQDYYMMSTIQTNSSAVRVINA